MTNSSRLTSAKKIRAGIMAIATAAVLANSIASGNAFAAKSGLADTVAEIDLGRSAFLQTDPQNEFLPADVSDTRLIDASIKAAALS